MWFWGANDIIRTTGFFYVMLLNFSMIWTERMMGWNSLHDCTKRDKRVVITILLLYSSAPQSPIGGSSTPEKSRFFLWFHGKHTQSFSRKLLSGILPLDQKPSKEPFSSSSVSQPLKAPLTFGRSQWTCGFMGRCWRSSWISLSPTSLMSNTLSKLPSRSIQVVFDLWRGSERRTRQCGARLAWHVCSACSILSRWLAGHDGMWWSSQRPYSFGKDLVSKKKKKQSLLSYSCRRSEPPLVNLSPVLTAFLSPPTTVIGVRSLRWSQ